MQLTLNEAEGQRLQREGQETVAAKNEKFLNEARMYAIICSKWSGSVTTDDIRLYMTSIGQYPTHHNAWGCIFKQKGWTVIGRQPSKLPSNHGRVINVYHWKGGGG